MSSKPWNRYPVPKPNRNKPIAVVGAGIAGASAAWFLAEAGQSVVMFDRLDRPGQDTSGNPSGLVLPYPARDNLPFTQYYDLAYGLTHWLIGRLESQGHPLKVRRVGAIQSLYQERLNTLYQQANLLPPHPFIHTLSPMETEAITGTHREPSFFYPQGLALSPSAFCEALVTHPRITFRGNTEISRITKNQDNWDLLDAQEAIIASAETVILATAHAINQQVPDAELPLLTTLGQLALFPQSLLPQPARTIINGKHYVMPPEDGHFLVGATWRYDRHGLHITDEENLELYEAIRSLYPSIPNQPVAPTLARKGRRTSTADHLPIVGPLPNGPGFRETYHKLHEGRRGPQPPAPWITGLYATVAHGARGLISGPAAGALLSALVLALEPPFPETVVHALNPARFIIRYLQRSPIHRKTPFSKPTS